MLDFLGKSAYNKDNKSGNQASHLTRQEENPLTELLSPKGGLLYLVLTAREPSIKPLADVVRCYIAATDSIKVVILGIFLTSPPE